MHIHETAYVAYCGIKNKPVIKLNQNYIRSIFSQFKWNKILINFLIFILFYMYCIPALSCNWFFSRASTRSKQCLSFLLCTHSLPIALSRALTRSLYAFSLTGNLTWGNLTEARSICLFSADTLTHITHLTYNNCQKILKEKQKEKENNLVSKLTSHTPQQLRSNWERCVCDTWRTADKACVPLTIHALAHSIHRQATNLRWDLPVSICDLN